MFFPYSIVIPSCFSIFHAQQWYLLVSEVVKASGRSVQSGSGAPELDEDLHDDRQDFEDHADGGKENPVEENLEGDVTKLTGRKKKLWELRNKMVSLSLATVHSSILLLIKNSSILLPIKKSAILFTSVNYRPLKLNGLWLCDCR